MFLDDEAEAAAQRHKEDHDWIRHKIQAEKDRSFFYKRAAEFVMQWSIAGILSFLTYKFGFHLSEK